MNVRVGCRPGASKLAPHEGQESAMSSTSDAQAGQFIAGRDDTAPGEAQQNAAAVAARKAHLVVG
jgi:hypothetical protein